jgi:hypothetical protein
MRSSEHRRHGTHQATVTRHTGLECDIALLSNPQSSIVAVAAGVDNGHKNDYGRQHAFPRTGKSIVGFCMGVRASSKTLRNSTSFPEQVRDRLMDGRLAQPTSKGGSDKSESLVPGKPVEITGSNTGIIADLHENAVRFFRTISWFFVSNIFSSKYCHFWRS